jgi:hypothetical protein
VSTAASVLLRAARPDDDAELLAMMETFNHGEGVKWRPERVAPALRRLLREPSLGAVLVLEDMHLEDVHLGDGASGRLAGYVIATFGSPTPSSPSSSCDPSIGASDSGDASSTPSRQRYSRPEPVRSTCKSARTTRRRAVSTNVPASKRYRV